MFRCSKLACNLDRCSHIIQGITFSHRQKYCAKRHKDVYANAVGDTTKAYLSLTISDFGFKTFNLSFKRVPGQDSIVEEQKL